jgi:AraC-like DNA-binding protein
MVAKNIMKAPPKHPPLEGGIIQSVVLVDRLIRPALATIHAPSLPGHLLHYCVEGEAEQEVSGQHQHIVPGTAVWYHENEAVRGRILQAPWVYYTVNFLAARLPPPPFERRMWKAPPAVGKRFQALLDAWRDAKAPPIARHIRVFALLLDLLLEAMPEVSSDHRADISTHLWWDIEAKLREDLSRPLDLRFLQSLTHRSRHSIIRACRLAVGVSPMKRVKQMRLSYARGLVLYSRLPMTEIALRVGYSRVQELSRDYHGRFGLTPTEDRQSGPDYRAQRIPGG